MSFKDKEWQLNRTMSQMERLSKKVCHYAGMGINPQCFECNGLDTDCGGYITSSEFKENKSSNMNAYFNQDVYLNIFSNNHQNKGGKGEVNCPFYYEINCIPPHYNARAQPCMECGIRFFYWSERSRFKEKEE